MQTILNNKATDRRIRKSIRRTSLRLEGKTFAGIRSSSSKDSQKIVYETVLPGRVTLNHDKHPNGSSYPASQIPLFSIPYSAREEVHVYFSSARYLQCFSADDCPNLLRDRCRTLRRHRNHKRLGACHDLWATTHIVSEHFAIIGRKILDSNSQQFSNNLQKSRRTAKRA